MIKVKSINVDIAEHFDNNNNSLGFLNLLESLDLRVQLATHKIKGYYFIVEGAKVTIDELGDVAGFPNGNFYSKELTYISRLIDIQFKNKH